MTSVGHSLMGLSLATVCLPSKLAAPRKAALLLGFAGLANLPDLPLPGWGHDRYDISHSIFVNVALMAVAAALLLAWPRFRALAWRGRLLAFGAGAWVSHFLLDSLYNHGLGIAIFWPFSQGRLNLSLPYFSTLSRGWHVDGVTARIIGIEVALYGSLLLFCVFLRWVWLRRRR